MTSYSLRDQNTGAGYTLQCTVDGPQPGAIIQVFVPRNSSDAYRTKAEIVSNWLIVLVIGVGSAAFTIRILYLMLKDIKKHS